MFSCWCLGIQQHWELTRQEIGHDLQTGKDCACTAVPELTWLSLQLERSPFMGYHLTHLMSQPCPVGTRSLCDSSNDHMHTLESSLAVVKQLSSGLKLIPRVGREPCQAVKWAGNI